MTAADTALIRSAIDSYADIYAGTSDLPTSVGGVLLSAAAAGAHPGTSTGSIFHTISDALFALERNPFDSSALRAQIPTVGPDWLADIARIAVGRHALFGGHLRAARSLAGGVTTGSPEVAAAADLLDANVLISDGQLTAARTLANSWPEDRHGDRDEILGSVAFWNADFVTAASRLRDSADAAFDSGRHLDVARILRLLALSETVDGADDAPDTLQLAVDHNKELGSVVGAAILEAVRGLHTARHGDAAGALTLFGSAEQRLDGFGAAEPLSLIHTAKAVAGLPSNRDLVDGPSNAVVAAIVDSLSPDADGFDHPDITVQVWRTVAGL
ncbi:hypothetical protein [Leifsonia sp. Leaf264]|uniref:hypothetical protein n=1 Tax=Leifsonia sp. Leaf264 TaxID=1736314 RepID=UPI0006F452EC|nr:hypothetical protein [Leifsonia sp. Leaf264]KQO98141.1 hypothetical protein ASF30_08765 [Leifsonia sp. Leaf264]